MKLYLSRLFCTRISIVVCSILCMAVLATSHAHAQKVVPLQYNTYMGAAVGDDDNGQYNNAQEINRLEGHMFGWNTNGNPNQRLALHMHYFGWSNNGAATFPDATGFMQDDVNNGRIPVVSWDCGDKDQNVLNGNDDTAIHAQAAAIIKFGHPIILRWFWEFNNDGASPSERNVDCLDKSLSPLDQRNTFIKTWKYIWNIFNTYKVTGYPNTANHYVTWLWNPAGTGNSAALFYPAPDTYDYVDWIGDDDYGNATLVQGQLVDGTWGRS